MRIAERKSLSAAARDLNTSQPSVSRQLIALEKLLGVVLVRRTTHSLSLTQDGVSLLADARRLISEWESIEDRQSQVGELQGTIRVVAPIALGQELLVHAVGEFMNEHPKISIDWRLDDAAIHFAEEGCDCWVKIGPVPDDTLIVKELAKVDRLVVGTRDCVSKYSGVPLRDLPWITLGPFEGNRIELFDKRDNNRTFVVKPKMGTNNIHALREAVLQGVGVAIMPSWFVASHLNSGTLINAAPEWRGARLSVNLAIAAGTRRPARVEQFSDHLKKCLSAQLNDY